MEVELKIEQAVETNAPAGEREVLRHELNKLEKQFEEEQAAAATILLT
jgi:hypothetical protein